MNNLVTALVAALSLVIPMGLGASEMNNSTPSKVIVKPGVVIPNKAMRQFSSKHKKPSYFGALAVSTANPAIWYSAGGMFSAQAAAAMAKLVCENKAGAQCDVVALTIPENLTVSFSQAMTESGVSGGCINMIERVRNPKKRSFILFGSCVFGYIAENGKQASAKIEDPGHSLYLARNGLFSAVAAYGPLGNEMKDAALRICEKMHADLMKSAKSGSTGWSDLEQRVRNRADLRRQRKALPILVASNPSLAKCHIVHSEILP